MNFIGLFSILGKLNEDDEVVDCSSRGKFLGIMIFPDNKSQ